VGIPLRFPAPKDPWESGACHVVVYKTTGYYAPAHERCVSWNDPQIAIAWPLQGAPVVSAKDQQGIALQDAEAFP